MGGVMAIRKGECHIAPVHLLDPESGVYNRYLFGRYISCSEVILLKGVGRSQGFIVRKGNPKNISGINDLLRDDIVFVNRQLGSGTRVLLDYMLDEEGLDADIIRGYEREMTTHMAVASAIKSELLMPDLVFTAQPHSTGLISYLSEERTMIF